MSTISLPPHATLTMMRKQARRLQAAALVGDDHARTLIARHLPDHHGPVPLHLAQLVVARGYGFASWPRLKHYLDTADGLRFDGGKPPARESAADRLCRLATLTYDGTDGAPRWAAARALLAADPALTHTHLWAAASAVDVAAVEVLLTTTGQATERGGPHGWTPLYYLAYSRLNPDAPSTDVLRIAQLLLDAGADPNEGYLWAGLTPPFTVLTGAFGEGEQGPERQPRHPHALALARLLLTAGADANDGQTLYNRMFGPDDDHLRLLFEFGLGRGSGGPWRDRLGDAVDTPADLLRSQLSWAIDHGFVDRVRLLIAHGVDLQQPLPDGQPPVAAALTAGRPAIADLLTAGGAPPATSDPVDRFIADALAGDATAVAAADPATVRRARDRRPGLLVWATACGFVDAVPLLVRSGFDVNAMGRGDTPVEQPWQTALHQAAGDGNLPLVTLLLDHGADPRRTDARFDATPAEWARHFDHHDVAALIDRRQGGTASDPHPTPDPTPDPA